MGINRTTKDLAWQVLPKEFKEEVKKEYKYETSLSRKSLMDHIFGHDNLTSDAEGEDEMLCVSRKEIQQLVAANDVVILEAAGIDNIETIQAKTVNTILNRLFGSKCLLDENKECSNPSVVNCKHKHGDGTCSLGNMCRHKSPKPAEPTIFSIESDKVSVLNYTLLKLEEAAKAVREALTKIN